MLPTSLAVHAARLQALRAKSAAHNPPSWLSDCGRWKVSHIVVGQATARSAAGPPGTHTGSQRLPSEAIVQTATKQQHASTPREIEQIQLYKRVWHASSAPELLHLVGAVDSDDVVSGPTAARALNRLSLLLRGAPEVERAAARASPALVELLAALERGARQCQPSDASAALQACVWLSLELQRCGGAADALAAQLAEQAPVADARDVVRSLAALARLGHSGAPLLDAVERLALAGGPAAGQQELGELGWLEAMRPMLLALLVWSLAKLGRGSPPLLQAAAAALAARGKVSQLSAGEAVQLLYSFGLLGHDPGAPLLPQLAALLRRCLPELAPQGLANAAYGLARLGCGDAELVAALAAAAAPRAAEFSTAELAMLLAAFSSLRVRDDLLLSAAAEQLATRAGSCSARDLSDLLSAMATLDFRPPPYMLAAAAHRAAALAPRAPPASLAWQLWAFARLGHRPNALLAALDRQARTDSARLHSFGPEELSKTLWALARMGHYSGEQVERCACATACHSIPPLRLLGR